MGKGNFCTHGKYEGLYYIDYDNIFSDMEDSLLCQIEDEEAINDIAFSLSNMFKSFYKIDELSNRHRGMKLILENELFQIGVVDNEWSYAICLIEREEREEYSGLMSKHYKNYLEGIKNVLVELFGEAIGYGGAWTSAARWTKDTMAC